MKMTKEFYEANVVKAVEVEYENGGRRWFEMWGDEVDDFIKALDDDEYLSDIDLCCHQPNEAVKKFLNVVDYNANHNPMYKGVGFYNVLAIALDNWDCIQQFLLFCFQFPYCNMKAAAVSLFLLKK